MGRGRRKREGRGRRKRVITDNLYMILHSGCVVYIYHYRKGNAHKRQRMCIASISDVNAAVS